jgi:hypothetical protein
MSNKLNILISKENSHDIIDMDYSFVMTIDFEDEKSTEDLMSKLKMFGNISNINHEKNKSLYSNLHMLNHFDIPNESSNYIFAFEPTYQGFSNSQVEVIMQSIINSVDGSNYSIKF